MKMRWSQLVEHFHQSTEVDTEDLEALHHFRISSKQLRYGFELLAPALDPKQREGAYRFVERLQDRLGRLHDHVVARKLFREWDSKRNRIARACNLNRLIDVENEMLQNERRDFVAWWTPSMKADMREAFDRLTLKSHGG